MTIPAALRAFAFGMLMAALLALGFGVGVVMGWPAQ